jgi:hypothetical protein
VASERAGILDKVRSSLREFGPMAGPLYLLDELLRRISPKLGLYAYEIMVQPITDKALLPAGLAKNLEFREIRRGDAEIELMPARPEIKELRFQQQAICLGAYQRGVLIGYIWFAFGAYEEDEVRCTYVLPTDYPSVFDFDLYVMPEKRMGIAFMAIWHGANRYLWERGIRFTFSRLTRFNTASRRSHARLGWKRVGTQVVLQMWGVELMISSLRPFVWLSASASTRPRMRLSPRVLVESQANSAPAPGASSVQQ